MGVHVPRIAAQPAPLPPAAGSRPTSVGQFAFRAIDGFARSGASLLLEDERGQLHSGRWDGERFVYSSGQAIGPAIAAYAARANG